MHICVILFYYSAPLLMLYCHAHGTLGLEKRILLIGMDEKKLGN
jgi:hypothetical protein